MNVARRKPKDTPKGKIVLHRTEKAPRNAVSKRKPNTENAGGPEGPEGSQRSKRSQSSKRPRVVYSEADGPAQIFLTKADEFDFELWEKPHADYFKKQVASARSSLTEKSMSDVLYQYGVWSVVYLERSIALRDNPDPPSAGCVKCRDAREGVNPDSKKGCTVCGLNGTVLYIRSKNSTRSATTVEIPTDGIASENHRPWNYRENADILVRAALDAQLLANPGADPREALCKSVSAVRRCRMLCKCKQWECICLGETVREKIDPGYETDPDTDETVAEMLRDVINPEHHKRLDRLHRAVKSREAKAKTKPNYKRSKFSDAVISLAATMSMVVSSLPEGLMDPVGILESPRLQEPPGVSEFHVPVEPRDGDGAFQASSITTEIQEPLTVEAFNEMIADDPFCSAFS